MRCLSWRDWYGRVHYADHSGQSVAPRWSDEAEASVSGAGKDLLSTHAM
jgi:hypothetical protein